VTRSWYIREQAGIAKEKGGQNSAALLKTCVSWTRLSSKLSTAQESSVNNGGEAWKHNLLLRVRTWSRW
jgi:hypothetical protein